MKNLLLIIIFFIFIGCGGNNKKNQIFSQSFSNVKILDNDNVIYMMMSTLVGYNDYIIGTYSKNYSSLISVVNPYNIIYKKCFLDTHIYINKALMIMKNMLLENLIIIKP